MSGLIVVFVLIPILYGGVMMLGLYLRYRRLRNEMLTTVYSHKGALNILRIYCRKRIQIP